jgi:hypothetical protein
MPRGKLELPWVGNRKKNVDDLVLRLPKHLRYFNWFCPFSVAAMVRHAETIGLSRGIQDVRRLVRSPVFARCLYCTLVAWSMNERGARLRPFSQFKARLVALGDDEELSELKNRTIFDLRPTEVGPVADSIWQLILRLDPAKTSSVIVSGTKALHHVLPDLVPPVDGAYTLRFFDVYLQRVQDKMIQRRRERYLFHRLYCAFAHVATRVWSSHASRIRTWSRCERPFYTSPLKVIDNAIVGAMLRQTRQGENDA